MNEFTKKPITIQAVQFTGDNHAEVEQFAPGKFQKIEPEDRVDDPDISAEIYDFLHSTWVGVKDGQWIIRGIKGEFYPCDADVFEASYAAGGIDQISDGYHTFAELYEFRMLYHAAFVNTLHEVQSLSGETHPRTVKSLKHSDGGMCFGGGWFIVVTELPYGQISNHYEIKHWNLFQVPAVDVPPAFDYHTTEDVVDRLRSFAEIWGRGSL